MSYGGVAIIWRESTVTFKEITIKNPHHFEVLAAVGKVKGQARKLVLVACYIPPNYSRIRGNQAQDFVENVIVDMKRKYSDPYLVVGGDFNQWRIENNLDNFADITEAPVGPTRKQKSIDRIFVNVGRAVAEAGTLEPLEAEDGDRLAKSDHRVAFCRVDLPRKQAFKWETYTYRYYNTASVEKFKEWVVMEGWSSVLEAEGTDAKAEAYQAAVNGAIERFFSAEEEEEEGHGPAVAGQKDEGYDIG